MSNIRRHYIEIKKVLRKQDLADFFTISKYGFSPYRACEHGCIYCDGRAEKYYIDGEFDRDIVIRKNIPELLEKEVANLREKGFVCIGSGVSDPYQPVEAEEKITRKCAEILLRHSVPVVIMTKSSLVLRDLDIWAELNSKSRVLLMVSLTFTDDESRKIFEPQADTVQNRIKTLFEFKKSGCSTGILAMPLLPFVTECEENAFALSSVANNVGADFFMPGGLTLRPGVQKETFLDCISRNFPDLKEKYIQIYSENRQSGSPAFFWRKKTAMLYEKMIAASGRPSEIPHYIYRNIVPLYEEVHLLFSQMQIAYQKNNTDTKRLQKASELFREWVLVNRKPINRSRKRCYDELDELLCRSCEDGTISTILDNEKLGRFVKDVVLSRYIFDSLELKLRV